MPTCKICLVKFIPIRSSLEKTCAEIDCRTKWYKQKLNVQLNKVLEVKKPINKISYRKKLEDVIYKSERIKFLMLPENKICPITKQPTTDVHHKKGRIGKLYLDQRFWIALSRIGHKFVEENPIWAKENGYSLSRLAND